MRGLTVFALVTFMFVVPSLTLADTFPCKLPGGNYVISDRTITSPMKMYFNCLHRELEELKRRQDDLEKIIPEYNRLAAELPTHFQNKNGAIIYEEGRRIGTAEFVLSARQLGGATSMELDDRAITDVCGETGGCMLRLIFRRFAFRSDEPVEATEAGPCSFTLDPETGAWLRGERCGAGASLRGVDGDGTATAAGSGSDVLLEAGPGCFLADADARRVSATRDGLLERDHARGFFLIAAPTFREDRATRFECAVDLR